MSLSDPIFRKDAKGGVRSWQYEVDGARWRTIIGHVGGKQIVSAWTYTQPKNVGRSNETSPEQQAALEADAELRKKLDREYRRTIPELESVPISPMLAQDFGKQKAIVFPVYSQPKLDGIRALVTRHGAFSREYQRHLNVANIMKALSGLFAEIPDLVLDGELYNHDLRDNFNRITSLVRREATSEVERKEAAAIIQFHCYDRVSSDPFAQRSHELRHEFLLGANSTIRTVPTDYARDSEELDALYGRYLEAGYEGQMVRLDGPYEADKRSARLLKRKEFITAEFQLLRVEEGAGNWAGYAKRAVFALPDGREVGAGIKGDRAFTQRLLSEAPTWGGSRQVTVRHFAPTPDGIPRFPVAVDFHPAGRGD